MALGVFSTGIFAQPKTGIVQPKGAEIRFSKTSHDFGRVKESIKYAVTRFEFQNTGDKPLFLSNVQASCGCTTTEYTKDTVWPGGKGFVEVSYETVKRLGTFSKTITVYSTADKTPFVHLDIKGDVYEEKFDADNNPVEDLGMLFLSKPTLNFNPLYDNGIDSQEVRLINGTVFTTNFNPLAELPAYVRVSGMPASLEPKESVTIKVYIDGRLIPKYGFGAVEIPLSSDNAVMPYFGMYISYTRKQFFPKMTEKQLAKQPRLTVDKKLINFGQRASGDVMRSSFTFKNTGKKELKIHEIYPECSCIQVHYDRKTLAAGDSMVVNFIYDTVTKNGSAKQSIWVVTNDPIEPERFLGVVAELPPLKRECPTCPK